MAGGLSNQIKCDGTGIASAACVELREEASQAEQGDHYSWCLVASLAANFWKPSIMFIYVIW